MQHFYDGQVRRYLTQMMRILANFPVQDGKGVQKDVPVTYGDLSRQVANLIRENSENKLPSAPRIAVYLTGLELDKDRLTDSSCICNCLLCCRRIDLRSSAFLYLSFGYLCKSVKTAFSKPF